MSENTKPMLNLGCGTVILPRERPWHHGIVDETIYAYPHWLNVDRNAGEGVDEIADLFTYPWPWADDSFSGALLSHLVEHIPHVPKIMGNTNGEYAHCGPFWAQSAGKWNARREYLAGLQDGWFAFFSELWRVLAPDAIAHVLFPHGHSDGALADPTHTRYVMPHTFDYLRPDERSAFHYAIGCHFELNNPPIYRFTEMFQSLWPVEEDTEETVAQKQRNLNLVLMIHENVAYDVYVALRTVKDADHD